jgi:predicted S18 family serine protease
MISLCAALFLLISIITLCALSIAGANSAYGQIQQQYDIMRDPSRLSHSIVFLTVSLDEYGNPLYGEAMQANVELSSGSGRVLINSEIPLGIDWQVAAKNATYIAQTITGIDFSTLDIIFSVEPILEYGPADYYALSKGGVDGGSAGAALTVLLLSDVLGIPINNDVLVTGAIQTNGMIGEVENIWYKAEAAKDLEARYMLVPEAGVGSVENLYELLATNIHQGMRLILVNDIGDVVTHLLGEEDIVPAYLRS